MKAGGYTDLQEIGRGGMGVVFRARSPRGEVVALKVLKKLDPDSLARFDRERRMIGGLGEAQGFVPLLDAGESGSPFIVMPFLEGGTLRARLERGAFPVAWACELARSLARALGSAHERGIVHRDLKPENVLFTRKGDRDGDWGRPLVADLGLAKHFDHEGLGASVSLSVDGSMRGTAGYMPPEQTRDAKNVGPPADVFALGAILYECLAGKPPFHGSSLTEVLARVEEGRFEPLGRVCPAAPRWLVRLVSKALAKDEGERFADGHALAHAIEAGLAGKEGGGRARFLLPVLGALVASGVVSLALLGRTSPPEVEKQSTGPSVAPTPSASRAAELPFFTRPLQRMKTARLLQTWGTCERKHRTAVLALAVSPDGRRAVAGTADGTLALWDLEAAFAGEGERREALGVLTGHTGSVLWVAFREDGRRVVSASADGTLSVWNEKGERTASLEHRSPVTTAALLADGRQAITVAQDGVLRLWSLDEKRLVRAFEPMDAADRDVRALAALPDGQAVVCGSSRGVVGLLSLASGEWVSKLDASPKPFMSIAVSPDGRRVLAGIVGDRPTITTIAVGSGGPGDLWADKKLSGLDASATSVAFSRDGKLALAGSNEGRVALWDVATGRRLGAADAHGNGMTTVAFLPDGERAVSAGWDLVLRLWDLRADRKGERRLVEVRPPAGPSRPLESVAVSPDGKLAAAACGDGTVRLFALGRPGEKAGAAEAARLAGPGEGVTSVAFSRDGRHVFAGGALGAIQAWSVGEVLRASGVAPVASFTAHKDVVRALAFSPDGTRLLSGGRDEVARLWDVRAILATAGPFEPLATLSGSLGDVFYVAFLPDGETGLTLGTEGSLRTWNLATGARILGYDTGKGEVRAALSPDGLWTLVGRVDDRSVTLWRFSIDPPRKLGAHDGPVHGVVITPDGRRGISVGLAGDVKVWDVVRGVEIDGATLGAADQLVSVAIAPDGRSFVVGTELGVLLRFGLEP